MQAHEAASWHAHPPALASEGVRLGRRISSAVSWFTVLLVAHVVLAVSLLAPSLVLPFLLRGSRDAAPGRASRALMAMQGGGGLLIGLGLLATGAGLVASLGTELLGKPWLLAAVAVYAVNLVIAGALSRPNLRRLARLDPADDQQGWRRTVRRQRYLAYGMGAAVGLIGFLMSAKPALW